MSICLGIAFLTLYTAAAAPGNGYRSNHTDGLSLSLLRDLTPTNAPLTLGATRDRNYEMGRKKNVALARVVSGKSFYFRAMVQQAPGNHGSLLSIRNRANTILDISSNTRKKQIRVRYHGSSGDLRSIRGKYDLSDGRWYDFVAEFHPNYIRLHINCTLVIAANVTGFNSTAAVADPSALRMWLGQRSTHHYFFRGKIATPILAAGSPGVVCQSFNSNRDENALQAKDHSDHFCPDCFDVLRYKVKYLEEEMKDLRKRVERFEGHMREVQLHHRGCTLNGASLAEGSVTRNKSSCVECSCFKGEVHCRPIGCQPLGCAKPVRKNGSCCPTCMKHCSYMGRVYEHGTVFWPKKCARCECMDGDMKCRYHVPEQCARLAHCPETKWIYRENECCPVCKGDDFCAKEPCHDNATCVNKKFDRECRCQEGYFGDGDECFDIDECQWAPEMAQQLGGCGVGSKCVNTAGSFRCDCLPGFVKIGDRNCLDVLLYR